jgi:hypothetical protein
MTIIEKRGHMKKIVNVNVDWKDVAKEYRSLLKKVYEVLTEPELIKSSREELEEVIEEAINEIDEAREDLPV